MFTKILTVAFAALAAPFAGNAIIATMPVVLMMSGSDTYREGGSVYMAVSGIKLRGCLLAKDTSAGWYMIDGALHQAVGFEFVGVVEENSRPPGAFSQDFGYWRWDGVPGEASAVVTTVTSICDGKPQLTTIGPLTL